MNKKIIVSMGLPMEIRNKAGSKATIELNQGNFVVCTYRPNNPVYLNDAKLEEWYPVNWFKRLIYELKFKNNQRNK